MNKKDEKCELAHCCECCECPANWKFALKSMMRRQNALAKHTPLWWLDKEQELADLKADLEMPSEEELDEIRKRLDRLEFKFNELIDMLYATNIVDKSFLFYKVKEEF